MAAPPTSPAGRVAEMLIDGWMGDYHFAERHALRVAAPPERVYAAARRLDFRGSWVIGALYALRSLPALLARRGRAREGSPLATTGDELLRSGGFVMLEEEPPRELVMGLVGRFWKPSGGLVPVTPEGFRAFAQPGYAVAAWNFTVAGEGHGSLLATETRVRCTDDAARRRFRPYWTLIRPFSGLIRMEILRSVRRAALADAR
ncbi:MAG TPA: hypothetical protein VNP72_02335 [Longimicrobium sp.]|nr:hypothetical protein [Longimicrobium sp.]